MLTIILVAMVVAPSGRAALYIVGDAPFGGWNPASGLEMATADNVVYTVEDVEISGTVYFIFASQLGDWTTVNSHRYGPTDANQPVSLNTAMATQISTNDQAAYYIDGEGVYDISFDMNAMTFTVTGTEIETEGTNMWMLGNAFGGSFDPSTGVKMKTTDHNVFTATVEMPASENRFSFTTMLADNWDDIKNYRYGSPSSSYNINSMLGTDIPIRKSTSSFLVGQGTYTVTVTLDAMTMKVEKDNVEPVDVWILGEVDDKSWAPNDGVKMSTNDYTHFTANVTCDGRHDGFNYFSFTKALSDDPEGWDDIAGERFGAVSEGDFVVLPEHYNRPLSLTANNGQSFKIPAGNYGLLVDLSTMKLTISGHSVEASAEDRAKCFIDNPEDKTVTFIFDPVLWNYTGTINNVYVRGSFTGWGNSDKCLMGYDTDGFYYVTLPYKDVKIPGNSGQPEFKFYVNGSYPGGSHSFVPEGYIFMNGDQNHIVVFEDDDFEQIKENSRIANTVRPVSDFDLTTEAGQQEVSNFRLVPGTRNLYRCYHPFKSSRPSFATELPRMQYVQELSAKHGILSDIVLSGDETGSLTTVTINGQQYQEHIPEYYQSIIDHNSVLYVGKNNSTPDYNTVYYSPDGSKYGTWIKEVGQFIADDNNRAPFSIHCRLGTDRTGVFSASLAAICGATWEEIAADYQLTNRLGIREFRDYHLLQYSMQKMLGVENINEVENLQEAVINYFTSKGYLTEAQVLAIQTKLCAQSGDINGDGNVNTGDVSELYKALLSGSTDPAYDLNGDGNVNTGDVSALYKIILGV